jgi:hypothetical protein
MSVFLSYSMLTPSSPARTIVRPFVYGYAQPVHSHDLGLKEDYIKKRKCWMEGRIRVDTNDSDIMERRQHPWELRK